MTLPQLPSLANVKRLLIVKTSSIGDILHALPAVEAIQRARPDISIDWVVRKRCASVLEGNPVIRALHVVPNKPTMRDLLSVRRDLRARRYDCALDLQGLGLSGLLTWLSGAPIRIGIDRNREGNAYFLTHPIVSAKLGGEHGDRHAVDILYGFSELFGAHPKRGEFPEQRYLTDGIASEVLVDVRALPCPRVALNVGASWEYKKWPVGYWVELADTLIEQGRSIVFVGDSKDAEVVGQVKIKMRAAEPIVDVSGRTSSLRELAAVLESCDVLVTGDTGPMHMGVAVGTPTVALFGATNSDRTGPYGARNIVLNMHLSCSPCYRKPTCDGRVDCMRAITPGMALEAVDRELAMGKRVA
ncbi:lipopolysaccharide heptosyltransferase I [Capsulimonas corticalis]|uniref:Lipopolysaccharide heptosyltransferase I n=1 Tax=Capsulimonas corticalis TaxID=2219043 RepID=A0A402CPK2_9BACT|nr:glycosyltransferase family 9 protein [Capsulimonas corticalis]BDI33049.1 lipopolysaccharide heptosyltransferase I [Capsulimonas corticalis]